MRVNASKSTLHADYMSEELETKMQPSIEQRVACTLDDSDCREGTNTKKLTHLYHKNLTHLFKPEISFASRDYY